MPDIPESLLRRSAEAKAKALGVPVEQVLAEMKGEGPPVEISQPEPPDAAAEKPPPEEMVVEAASAVGEVAETPEVIEETAPVGEEPAPAADAPEPPAEDDSGPDSAAQPEAPPQGDAAIGDTGDVAAPAAETEQVAAAVATVEEPPPSQQTANGGNGKVAGLVSPRPSVPPAGLPEGVRTQRLLTVVKARAIQNVKAEPGDKVNTWPHLMLMEFGALLAITGLLIVMSVVIHSPLLDPANFNATPNPSKAPWYFLGLQELLSYFDPQIAGVMVPLFIGMIGFMAIPYVDKNPSTRPSDRKFAIMLYTIFLAGASTLTIFGVLFRGKGFNFSYPWRDGVFFDDLKDWVQFE